MVKKIGILVVLVLGVTLLFVACKKEETVATPTTTAPTATRAAPTATSAAQTPTQGTTAGDPAAGKTVYTGKGTCFGCHTIQGVSSGSVGPDLTHIATVGATRKSGMSAEAYIRESIVSPAAFIAAGFSNAMPPTFGQTLSAAEMNNLVAYLLTLK